MKIFKWILGLKLLLISDILKWNWIGLGFWSIISWVGAFQWALGLGIRLGFGLGLCNPSSVPKILAQNPSFPHD